VIPLSHQTATYHTALEMSRRLRSEDKRELRDFTGLPVTAALCRSVLVSERVYFVAHKGRPVILYGVADSPEDARSGSVWLVATTDVPRVAKGFLRAVPAILAAFHSMYPHGLQAYADGRNALHLRWLQAAGFTLGDTVLLGEVPFVHATHKPCALP
jgi:hypothetical protein